jgi:acetyl esterase/lipase
MTMALDQETQRFIEQLRSRLPTIGSVTPAHFREAQANAAALTPKGPDLARVEDVLIDTPAGPLPVRLYVPHSRPIALILYMHGGGWTIGSVATSDHTVRKLAQTASCAVASVDYRLAPEHPFPAAVEDAMEALSWTARQNHNIAGGSVPLIVAGDSAGANLATVLARLARDAQGPPIAAQVLIYPSTMGDVDAPALKEFDAAFLTRAEIVWFFDQYVPDRRLRADPRFAPMHTRDLSRLPPAFILTAENDLLRREAEEYGLRLVQAGVPVAMRRYLGTVHGFINFIGLRQWEAAYADIATFVKAATSWATSTHG